MAETLWIVEAGWVGPRRIAVGAKAGFRFGDDSELVVTQAHGKYHEANVRGRLYTGGTAATGVAPGTAIGTTGAFTIFNPPGSKIITSVKRVSMGYVSGTLGAGVVHYLLNQNPRAADVTGTAISLYRGGSQRQPATKMFTTSTLPATPLVLRPFCSLGASLASTAVQPWQIMEDVDGEFELEPGSALTLHATAAAGTSPLVVFGATIEEIDQ